MSEKIMNFHKKDSIIRSGDKEQRMYIIRRGEVEISLTENMKKIVLATLKKNDFFGEISLYNKTPRTADAIALTDVELVCLDNKKELDLYLSRNPDFSQRMAQVLVSRLARTNELLKKEIDGKSQATLTGFMW